LPDQLEENLKGRYTPLRRTNSQEFTSVGHDVESQLQHLLLIVAKHREDIPIQSEDADLKNIIM